MDSVLKLTVELTMDSAKKALRFVLCLLPVAAAAGWFVVRYQFALLSHMLFHIISKTI